MGNTVFNFIYIGCIVIGTIAMTLSIVLNLKVKEKGQYGLEKFFIAMFIYVLIDFLAYYFLYQDVSDRVVFAFIVASDVVSVFTAAAWQYLVVVMAGIEDRIHGKLIAGIMGVYLISRQAASIVFGEYRDGRILVPSVSGKYYLEILSAAYSVCFIIISIICLKEIMKKERGYKKFIDFSFDITLILSMLWLAYWDYNTWFVESNHMRQQYGLDPMLLIYLFQTIVFLIYFMKADPLKLSDVKLAPEEAMELLSKHCGLSNRERDVLGCINDGMSNADIAETLYISENTVKRHINSILKKTETKNRHELLYKLRNTGSDI